MGIRKGLLIRGYARREAELEAWKWRRTSMNEEIGASPWMTIFWSWGNNFGNGLSRDNSLEIDTRTQDFISKGAGLAHEFAVTISIGARIPDTTKISPGRKPDHID